MGCPQYSKRARALDGAHKNSFRAAPPSDLANAFLSPDEIAIGQALGIQDLFHDVGFIARSLAERQALLVLAYRVIRQAPLQARFRLAEMTPQRRSGGIVMKALRFFLEGQGRVELPIEQELIRFLRQMLMEAVCQRGLEHEAEPLPLCVKKTPALI